MSYGKNNEVVLTVIPTGDPVQAASQELAKNLGWLDRRRLGGNTSEFALKSLERVMEARTQAQEDVLLASIEVNTQKMLASIGAKSVSALSAIKNALAAELNVADAASKSGLLEDLSMHAKQYMCDINHVTHELEAKEIQNQDAARIIKAMNDFKELNMTLAENRARAVIGTRHMMSEKLLGSTNGEDA
jgi:hypothetical protein